MSLEHLQPFELLLKLSREGKIFGLKAETESEGLDWNSIAYLRIFSEKVNLPFSLKIGGVEAVSDLVSATYLDIDTVVAPMVESSFSVQKFMQAIDKSGIQGVRKKILVETSGGVHSLQKILDNHHNQIDGVNFGRSDLLGSLNSVTGVVHSFGSEEFMNLLCSGIEIAKSHSLPVTVGGHVTRESLQELLMLESAFQPDYIETRRFILPFNELSSDILLLERVLSIERFLIEKLLGISARRLEVLVAYTSEISKRITGASESFEIL